MKVAVRLLTPLPFIQATLELLMSLDGVVISALAFGQIKNGEVSTKPLSPEPY